MMVDTATPAVTHMGALGRWSGNDPDRPLVCVITNHRARGADAEEVQYTAERLQAGAWPCLKTIVPEAKAAAAMFERGYSPAAADGPGGEAFESAAQELIALHLGRKSGRPARPGWRAGRPAGCAARRSAEGWRRGSGADRTRSRLLHRIGAENADPSVSEKIRRIIPDDHALIRLSDSIFLQGHVPIVQAL